MGKRIFSRQIVKALKISTLGTFFKARFFDSSFVVVLVVIGLAGYIFQVNVSTLKGYKLEEKRLEAGNLQKVQQELLLREAKLRSMERIGDVVLGLQMESIEEVIYIDAGKTTVAIK